MADRFQSHRTAKTAVALWRRLDDPGHDAARLEPRDSGWLLRGAAVFNHGGEPACLGYTVELDATWATRTAEVHGFVGRRELAHSIARVDGDWIHNGVRVEGMSHLVDIDFGFTPATNLQQLRRVALRVGQEVELPVAWLNVDSVRLVELPQHYRRLSRTEYDYSAPSVPYRATLEIAENGFATRYPTGWERER